MVNCEGCGAAIDVNDTKCPYCGHSILQRVEVQKSAMENQERTYGTTRDEEGNVHIRFGDGQSGSRLPSGSGSVTNQYRHGAGSQGDVGFRSLEEKLDRIERIPDPSRHKESKDLGVTLVESISAIGDLTTFYQSHISQESHLSTDEHERLSKKEERVRLKLAAIVAYCDRVDSKAKKKIGLSNSEVHKVRTTAVGALQMTESGRCPKCGTMNRLGTKQCQNCGVHL